MFRLLKDFAYFVVALVELLLTFRFVLKLFGANPAARFVDWIYQTTQPLLEPFIPAFPTPALRDGYVLEFTTLFAIFVYGFIGYLVEEMLSTVSNRSR